MADYSQKWHNRTSRSISTETFDGLEAIQAQLNNLGNQPSITPSEIQEKAYSKASQSIPQKEKDPGSFTLLCFINNVCFDNALVNLGASVNVMPLSTYLNLGLGELAHTKLTVELADRTVKYPKGIAENVLVGIGIFTFPVDFIILDMPEDIKVPLILGRPFLSTARAKIDVYKKKITLRIIRPFFEDYIELNDLNEPFELRRNQGDDLMPTIEEGEVIEKFRTRDDELDIGIDDYPSYCDYDKNIHIDFVIVMFIFLNINMRSLKRSKCLKMKLKINLGRPLLDMVRSMMNLTTLPLSFWDYALESATRILNMVPTKKVDKTPYEMWYGKVPNLSYLKVWGCEALVKRDTPDKLEQRSVKCIFIGYPKETMGYYFYFPPENKIVVARYAEFFKKRLINQEISGRAVDLEEIQEQEDTSPSEITSNIPQEVEGFGPPPQEEEIPIHRSERTRRVPNRLCLNVEVEEHSLGDLNKPTSYKAAMLDAESNKWIDAMNAEIQSMIDNKVWVLVDLPPGCKTVGSKWLFKKKTDMDEKFSPIADIRAIRILISITSYYDYEIWQMDVKTAFLNGYLDEDIYMVQPEGFIDPNHPRKVCKLKRSIYGLKQTSRSWNKIFNEEIKRSKRLIGLSQNAYMDKILKRYKIDNSKRGHIPMQERLDLNKTQGASTPKEVKHMQNVPYASAVGSIMYAICLWFMVEKSEAELRVDCYCDAGFEIDRDDIKSQTRYVFILNGGAVGWKSSKQSTTAMSAIEAEYIAASEAAMEARHFKKLSLEELDRLDFNLLSDQEYSEEEVAETMAETMEQYMSKTRVDYGSGTNTFSGSDHEDANEHIEKVLEIVDLFHISNITIDQVMLRAFHMSLTGAASRWLRNEPTGSITTWDGLKTKFLNRYCPPARTAKKIKEINNFRQEPDENLYQAWERFKELLMKCPQHYLTEMQEIGFEQCNRDPGSTQRFPTKREGKTLKKLTTFNLVDFFKERDGIYEQSLDSIKEPRRSIKTLRNSTISSKNELADSYMIRRIGSSQYAVSTRQSLTLMYETRQTTIPFPSHLNGYYYEEKKRPYRLKFLEAYFEAS
ncbi:retrotransposon protein, putative, ty1-copia subclass [Tanacetum coccineum]